jgi:macrolide-specific efflux system membrane fusion protein
VTIVRFQSGQTAEVDWEKFRGTVLADELVDDGTTVETIGEMVRLGVMNSEAHRLAKNLGVDAIKGAIEYTKRRMADKRQDKFGNPAAYLRQALINRCAGDQESDAAKGARVPKLDLKAVHLQEQHMGKSRTLWLVGLLLAAGSLGFWYVPHGNSKTNTYVTARVERGAIEETVSAIGSLQPLQFVDVGTQVTGQLKTLQVAIGKIVKAGDLLAEIDPTLFESRVASTSANLASLRAQLAEKIAMQRLARQLHERNQKLFRGDATSEETLQQSAAAEEQASAQVASLEALIAQAGSQLQADEANLRYTKIHAPIAGTVVSLTVRQGQTLVSNQQAPTILRIADLNTMTVWAQVSEADVPKVRVGMPAYFSTLGESERRWHGVVRQILPTPEVVNNVVLYSVLFDADNPDQSLKPQMSAQVYFVASSAEGALLVPTAALQPLHGKSRGSVPGNAQGETKGGAGTAAVAADRSRTFRVPVLKDGQVEDRKVTVGLTTRLQAQVLSGLAEGDTVIVASAEKQDQDKLSKTQPRPERRF